MDYLKYPSRKIGHILTLPFICSLLVPIVILDFFMELYHTVCFPIYGIKKVSRSKHIKVDRHKLKYLNVRQKINCIYCGYSNGVLNYAATIAAETEKYWCGIKHKQDKDFVEPRYHKDLLEYNDKEGFEEKYKNPAK